MSETETLTFEQAFAELEQNVRELEAGGLTLDEGMALFERGQALVARCNKQLDEAELRIKQITPEGEVAFDKGE